jgi:hypothetical protein
MLRMTGESGSATMVQERIAAFDRARTFVTLLVVLHHSVLNFTYFGHGDSQRWLGFDLVVLFNDSFFMAFMFFISGLFVWDGLTDKGWAVFLRDRAWRLGVPLLISVFVLMPIAYYPTFLRYHAPGTTDFSFLHFWRNSFIVGPWPSGPAWFLWVLLALDALAAAVWCFAPGIVKTPSRMLAGLRDRPITVFVIFLTVTIAAYEPMRLTFGDASWWEIGALPLPIQTSRILLYTAYFFAGVIVGATRLRTGLLAEDGELAKRWPIWLALAIASYGAILGLVYVHHNWVVNFNAPPQWWNVSYSLAFATSAARCALRSRRSICASASADGACSTRCGRRPMASICCTIFSLSGCNTRSTTCRFTRARNSRSFSSARSR